MLYRSTISLVLVLCAGLRPAIATPAETQILDTLKRFFAALEIRDATTIGELLLPDGEVIVSRETVDGPRLGRTTHADYVASLANGNSHLLERIWDPVVQVRGSVAGVWTPYDFYIDGEFHHCGVNSFNLVRIDDDWKIAAVVYSAANVDCPPSPLGPPSFSLSPR